MSSSGATIIRESAHEKMSELVEKVLPRRDYLILPVLGLLTAVAMLGSAELAAHVIWKKNINDPCLVHTLSGDRYKPSCTSMLKIPEGPWVVNKYNECGYRSGSSCLTRPPGTIRIAVLGTSAAEGHMVVYERTYTALMEQKLSRACDRPVEIQNLAVAGILMFDAADRLDEALALEPDAVLFLLTPVDLWKDMDARSSGTGRYAASQPPAEAADPGPRQWFQSLASQARQSTALAMMRYYVYRDPKLYLQLYLQPGGVSTDFLRSPPTPPWQEEFNRVDALLGGMAKKIAAQHIPFAVVASVFRPQISLLHSGDSFPNKDPYVFQQELVEIGEKHGIVNFGVIDDFKQIPHADQYFYMADGHMNARGHEILAQSLTRQILGSHILEPAGCAVRTSPKQIVQR